MTDEDSHLEEAYEDRFDPDPYDEDENERGAYPEPEEEEVEDPNPLGVDVEQAVSTITGGDGEQWNAPRRLVAMVDLPDRRELTWQARNLLMESDIREAMAKAAYKLHAHYLQRDYNNIGFVFDPELIEYDLTRLQTGMDIGADTQVKGTESLARVLVATVLIKRP